MHDISIYDHAIDVFTKNKNDDLSTKLLKREFDENPLEIFNRKTD